MSPNGDNGGEPEMTDRETQARPKGLARSRDRAATSARILEAARRLIAREGFPGFGLNALAAEAGCDKVLIRRYFGDLDGVLQALGGELGFWLGDAAPVAVEGDYAARMAALFEAYAKALRGDVLLQRVLAWELVEPSVALRRLEGARSQAIGAWMERVRGETRAPDGVDAPAINAVLLAALHYLTLRESTLQGFTGFDLASPEGRSRIDAAFRLLQSRAFGAPTEGDPS